MRGSYFYFWWISVCFVDSVIRVGVLSSPLSSTNDSISEDSTSAYLMPDRRVGQAFLSARNAKAMSSSNKQEHLFHLNLLY